MKPYTITHNEKYGSIEIAFAEMPTALIRCQLKELGFRWHSQKRLWYGYAEESAVLAAIDPNTEPETEPTSAAAETPVPDHPILTGSDASRIYGILNAAEEAMKDDPNLYAKEKISEAIAALCEISGTEKAKRTGKTEVRAAVKRILKNAAKDPRTVFHYADIWNDCQVFSDSFRAVVLLEKLDGFPERPAEIPPIKWEKLMVKPDKTHALTLPDSAKLKAWITRRKEAWKASHGGSMKGMPDLRYDFGEGKPVVNALFLLDMLEALPGSSAEFTGSISAIHFTAETGTGLLMPVRPEKNDGIETDLAA